MIVDLFAADARFGLGLALVTTWDGPDDSPVACGVVSAAGDVDIYRGRQCRLQADNGVETEVNTTPILRQLSASLYLPLSLFPAPLPLRLPR